MRVQEKKPPKGKREPVEQPSSQPPYASKWELVAAGLGLMIVLGMLGSIAFYGLTTTRSAPAVTIEHVATEATAGGYLVRFRAQNANSSTAAELHIRGELHDGDQVIDSGQTTVDYLPGHSERHGGIFFRRDPSQHELKLYPLGYVEP